MTDLQPDLELQLERIISAPHDARFAIRQLLDGAADDDFWENALLATSEMVSHSLTHASGECRLSAWYSPAAGWLRVELNDAGGAPLPNAQDTASHPEMGDLRLAVLLEVPAAWGVENTPFGRLIWFEVQRQQPRSSPSGGH